MSCIGQGISKVRNRSYTFFSGKKKKGGREAKRRKEPDKSEQGKLGRNREGKNKDIYCAHACILL